MRAPRSLRSLQRARSQVRRMNEMDRVVRAASEHPGDAPSEFHATSGFSTIERGAETRRWMPHDYRPIVGFTPNTRSTK